MKKTFFLALLGLILTTQGAFAATCNSDRDKLTVGEWCISSQDTLIPSASAGQQVVYERYTTANTPNQLIETESGKVLVDTGGASGIALAAGNGGSKHTLPRAAPGLNYKICTGSRAVITVDTIDTSDLIEVSISGTALDAGDSLRSTGQAGECLTVTSTVANKWNAEMDPAVWTDNGTS